MKQPKHETPAQLYIPDSLLLLSGAAAAQPQENIEYKADGIYVNQITVAELEEMYRLYGYKDYIYMRDWVYPPIFLTRLPSDFAKYLIRKNAINCFCRFSTFDAEVKR